MTPAPAPAGPQAELNAVLAVCAERGVDDHARFCAVLTGFAESDFVPRKHPTDSTFGVFQQNPRWWPTALGTTAEQCGAFLDAFGRIKRTGVAVWDCWQVQRWTLPGQPTPLTDSTAFALLPNTANYLRRVALVHDIVKTGRLP